MPAIYEIYGTDAHLMAYSLMSAADVAAMIPKKAAIALKPNLVIAAGPEGGATTHSGVLSGCIAYLQENGFSDISVIEGSWVGDNTDRAMKACGYDKVCRDCNVPFYDLKKDKTRGGNPVHTNRMMLGTDPVQIDAYGCRLMGLELDDVPYIRLAEQWGAGSTRIEDIIALNEPQNAADYPETSGLVRRLTRNVKADSACSACYASLVRALYVADKERIPVREEISIGQGFRGKKTDGIGIGNCCRGFSQCVTGCPPTASDVIDVFKRKAESGSRI